MPPCIKTRRLHLIPYTREQLQLAIADFSKPAVALGLFIPPCDNRERALRLRIYHAKLWLMRQYPEAHLLCTTWQMVLPEQKCIIGELGFKGPPVAGEVEIGYGVRESYRRQGYTTEAVQALCHFAFSLPDPAVTRVMALTKWRNRASQQVLRKCGFVRRGRNGLFLLRWILEKQ